MWVMVRDRGHQAGTADTKPGPRTPDPVSTVPTTCPRSQPLAPTPLHTTQAHPFHPHREQSSPTSGANPSACGLAPCMHRPNPSPQGLSPRLLGSPLVYRRRTHKPRGYPAILSGCPAATHRRDRSLCARDPYGDDLGVRIWCTKSPRRGPKWAPTERQKSRRTPQMAGTWAGPPPSEDRLLGGSRSSAV